MGGVARIPGRTAAFGPEELRRTQESGWNRFGTGSNRTPSCVGVLPDRAQLCVHPRTDARVPGLSPAPLLLLLGWAAVRPGTSCSHRARWARLVPPLPPLES